MKPLFWTDTGLRSGAENAAVDRRDLAAAATGRRRDVHLRFWASTPTASLGAHQAADRALRLDFCREAGIAIVRRISGGGAEYLDRGQQGFTLVAPRLQFGPGADLAAILRRCADGLIRGLADLGIRSQHEWPGNIEAGGRRIGGFFAAAEGPAVLVHGSVLLEADVLTMLKALRAPTEKLSRDGLASARDRLATVGDVLGHAVAPAAVRGALLAGLGEIFDALPTVQPGAVAPLAADWREQEAARAHAIDWSERPAETVEALLVSEAGPLRARARFIGDDGRLAEIGFASDGQCSPGDLWTRLAGALSNKAPAAVACAVAEVLATTAAETIGFGAADICQLVAQAADKHRMLGALGLPANAAGALMVCGAAGQSAMAILAHASAVLIPYCAKPVWCEWRHQDDCTECGLCAVGEAYRLARERGLRAITVTSYEHLVATLAALRDGGESAYVGMCCGNFYVKRFRAFREAGLGAVLMDISGANCYELQQEDLAYAGKFAAEAQLDENLLQRVMHCVPPLPPKR